MKKQHLEYLHEMKKAEKEAKKEAESEAQTPAGTRVTS